MGSTLLRAYLIFRVASPATWACSCSGESSAPPVTNYPAPSPNPLGKRRRNQNPLVERMAHRGDPADLVDRRAEDRGAQPVAACAGMTRTPLGEAEHAEGWIATLSLLPVSASKRGRRLSGWFILLELSGGLDCRVKPGNDGMV